MQMPQLIEGNVNGIVVTLKINTTAAEKGKEFTISFQDDVKRISHSRLSLVIAIIINVIAFVSVKINITAFLSIFVGFAFLLILWVTHSVQSEWASFVPLVGIQSRIKYVVGQEDRFIPWSSIDDVIINEVIHMNRVLYYLTVLVKEEDNIKLIPLFKHTKPRLSMLQVIYSEIQALLQSGEFQVESTGVSGDT